MSASLDPISFQKHLHSCFDLLVEASSYQARIDKNIEVSRVKRQTACMQIIEKGLDFKHTTSQDDDTDFPGTFNGLITPKVLLEALKSPLNPLNNWFTCMMGPEERRAFVQFAVM